MFKPVFNLKNAYYESWKKLPLPRIASTAHLRRSFLTTLASPLRFFLLILHSTRAFSVAAWNPDHGIYLTGLRQLRVYMNDCPRLPADRRGKTEEQNKWVKQIESIVNDDPEFRNKVVHTTYRKIAFKNGYYDCDKKALCDYNRDVYFLMKGSIDFEESDECVRQEVWDKLFMGVFGTEEVSKYMLQSFARAMAGEIKDKRLFFIIGEPNSGKGTITEVILYGVFLEVLKFKT